MKNSSFARFARAFFIFWHFVAVLVLSTTWNDLFCSCVDDVSIWWQMFNFVLLCPKRWFQINSRTVRTHFSSIITLNNWKVIAETKGYIFRWRSRFRRRRVCLSSLLQIKAPGVCRVLVDVVVDEIRTTRRRFSRMICFYLKGNHFRLVPWSEAAKTRLHHFDQCHWRKLQGNEPTDGWSVPH